MIWENFVDMPLVNFAFGKLWLWPSPCIPNSPALLTKNTIKSNSIGYLKKVILCPSCVLNFKGTA